MSEAASSGEQFDIRFGDQGATIVELGGGVRVYEVAGHDDGWMLGTTVTGHSRLARSERIGPGADAYAMVDHGAGGCEILQVRPASRVTKQIGVV